MKRRKSMLRPATREDAFYLSTRLRQEDMQGIQAGSGSEPLEVLLQGLELSAPHALVLEAEGKPYAIGGIQDMGEGMGLVWLLATPEVERHALDFHRAAKMVLHWLFTKGGYTDIGGCVSAEHRKAVTWLERFAGAHFFGRDLLIGCEGQAFHAFIIRKQNHV